VIFTISRYLHSELFEMLLAVEFVDRYGSKQKRFRNEFLKFLSFYVAVHVFGMPGVSKIE